jgi:hypothetical protein
MRYKSLNLSIPLYKYHINYNVVMTYEVDSTEDDLGVDVKELTIPFKFSTSGLTSAQQLIDTTSSTDVSYDSTV